MTAFCYYYGRGTEIDYNKAFEIFFNLEKEHNDDDIQYMLAECYYYGRGVEENFDKAFKTFYELVEKNNKEIFYNYILY